MNHLEKNDDFIKQTIRKHNKDFMRLFCGYEGDGKTLLACKEALYFDPGFDVNTQAIYNLQQLIEFQNIYEGTPNKVAFLDEAVLQLLGEESNTKDSKNTKKLFVTHRDRGHIYFLCSPSPWLMNPYIREWRVRDCVIIYSDWMSEGLDRRYAYYSKHEYSSFITSNKARKQIVVPYDFVHRYKPAFDEHFPMVTDEKALQVYKEMSKKKLEAQRQLRQEISNDCSLESENGSADNKSAVYDKLLQLRNNSIILSVRSGVKQSDVGKVYGLSKAMISGIVSSVQFNKKLIKNATYTQKR